MLELQGLQKRYGEVVALEDCSFAAEPGRMIGFLGPNGSGKTTAMRAVFGLVGLDAGRVTWRGAPVGPEERRRFGYMPEQRGLYPRMHVREQIVYFARLHGLTARDAGATADRWLERLGLADRAGARVEELSHGNQQRVQLIVALAHRADLLVLDEPFSGLDPIGVETLGEVVREEAERGAAVVFSSHQLDLVEDLCDDVAVINRGRIVLQGALREVRRASRYRHLEVTLAPEPDGAAREWPAAVDGAEVVWQRDGQTRLRVPADASPESLMAAAASAGRVESFRFEPPSLSDLFLEAVRA